MDIKAMFRSKRSVIFDRPLIINLAILRRVRREVAINTSVRRDVTSSCVAV